MTRFLLNLVALVVPHAARPRWREEWLAEMDHARARGRGMGALMRMAAGSIPDALETRRIATAAGRAARAGIFHALDQDLRYALRGLIYQPARSLFLRLDGSGRFNAAALHAAARAIDARVPITGVTTLADMRLNHNVDVKFMGRAVGGLGLLALMLAAGGLSSVVSYIVSLRRQEVGIRIALGAGAVSIVGMIVRQALLPTLIGAAAGAAGAAVTGALIRSRMYGASAVDPIAFAGATLLMLAVMLLASWLPARHAGRVDPISVLRQD